MPGLREAFAETLHRHGVEADAVERLWAEIADAHSARGRHYHTLEHLGDLHAKLEPFRTGMNAPDAVVLAIAYHDIVYRVGRSDNERRSADLMRERLASPGLPETTLRNAEDHILATHDHAPGSGPDTDLFTDADLSILGTEPARYLPYTGQVRREYRRYPDFLYRPGRRKVLERFLAMPRIFKTSAFADRFEERARENMRAELVRLGG